MSTCHEADPSPVAGHVVRSIDLCPSGSQNNFIALLAGRAMEVKPETSKLYFPVNPNPPHSRGQWVRFDPFQTATHKAAVSSNRRQVWVRCQHANVTARCFLLDRAHILSRREVTKKDLGDIEPHSEHCQCISCTEGKWLHLMMEGRKCRFEVLQAAHTESRPTAPMGGVTQRKLSYSLDMTVC